MMKIQCLGTKDKSDFILYLAHTIAAQGKRVLVADSSKDARFFHGIATIEPNENIYEVQGIEIVCKAHSFAEVEQKLKADNEDISQFDCMIVDVDDVATLNKDWGKFDHTLYISDNDRFNINKDVDLLHRYLDNTSAQEIRRVHFESIYRIPSGYIELKMNHRASFSENSFEIEFDEKLEELRIMLQHNQVIPYKKLPKAYKNMLTELVVEWLALLPKDVEKAAKPNLFGKYINRPRTS